MNRLLESLSNFCAAHPLEEKLLVAPSRLAGRQITDALARSGRAWANVRVETLHSLALSAASPEIARRGLRVLSRAQVRTLVEEACRKTLSGDSYFGALAASRGFHRGLSATLLELRAAGVAPGTLRRTLPAPAKAEDLARLLEAYEAALSEGGFLDAPAARRLAGELARAGRLRRRGAHALLPEEPPAAPGDRALAAALTERLTELPCDRPEEWRAGAETSFFSALGPEAELREALRRTVAAGVPFDDVEILCTDRATYVPAAAELFEELSVPATFSDGLPVAHTPPGRLLLAFLEWIDSDFEDRALRHLFLADAWRFASERLTPASAARIVREARIGWGRARYAPRLARLAREQEDPVRKEEVEAVSREAARLLSHAPPGAGAPAALAELARACASLVSESGVRRSDLDAAAEQAILRVLADLSEIETSRSAAREGIARIREAVEELSVESLALTLPQPGRLHLSSVRDGGYAARGHVFVVGLEETLHPGSPGEDPVLLDEERLRIAPRELTLHGASAEESERRLRACLARQRARVTLSFPCRDLSENRERFPAPFLLAAYRSASGNASATGETLAQALGSPAGFLPDPDAALEPGEWWAGAVSRAGAGAALAADVEAAFPWLADGRRAREERSSERFTIYDGSLGGSARALDPRESGEPISSHALQLLARCPFAYFVQYVLRAFPPEDVERDPSSWLGSERLGRLLHQIYFEFYRDAPEAGVAGGAERLREIARRCIEEAAEETPSPNAVAFERDRRRVERACAMFLKAEERHLGEGRLTPCDFERPFGEAGVPPVPVRLPGGGSVLLKGRVDRVDQRPDGEIEVWDYKTGRGYDLNPRGGLSGGRTLQHAVYALAMREIHLSEVARAGYELVGPEGSGQRVGFPRDDEGARATIEELCAMIAAGAFLHDPARECDACAWGICGVAIPETKESETIRRKLASEGNPELAPYRRLNPDPASRPRRGGRRARGR